MPAPVPEQRTNPRYQDVQVSASIRGRTWRDLAHLYHWLRAHGQLIVPAHSPGAVAGDGAPTVLRYRVEPGPTAIARVWQVLVRSTVPYADAVGQAVITLPSGATRSVTPAYYEFDTYYDGTPGHLFVEELPAKSAALTTLELAVGATPKGTPVLIESVACWELPRAALTVAQLVLNPVDKGVDVESFRAGAPIYYDPPSQQRRSVSALARGLAETECRRHLHQHAFAPVSITAADGEVELYALPVPIVPRTDGRRVTELPWAVYARVTDPAGQATITMETVLTGADSVVIDGGTHGTTYAMHGGAVEAETEDLSTADGDAGEALQVRIEHSGPGAVELAGVYLWEPASP